jgi:hypothetical protein
VFGPLFNGGDFTSSHLFVVLCTGLAFLAVQLALTIRCYVRMRRKERLINLLAHEFEQGRAGRKQPEPRFSNADWVQWVFANFPANAGGAAGNFSRDDALHELDVRITSNGDYLLLQRMGIMAPLLGVVLTVIGFYWLKLGEEEQSLQAILLAVAPLVSGVGTGAVLALINQALLHIVGHRAESLRMTARKWFDTAIWSRVDLDGRSARGRAVMAMDDLTTSLGEASNRYVDGASQIHESTASISRAASAFHDVIQSLSGEIRSIPESLHDVRRATSASAEAINELIRVGSRAAADLDVSVAAFRTTIDREFRAAAKLQHRSGRLIAKSAQQLDDATEQIRAGSHGLKHSAEIGQSSFQRLDESLRKNVLAGNQQFRDTVNVLTAQVAAFSHDVQALSAVADSVAGEFNQAAGGLMPSVASFREAIENRFSTAVSMQAAHMEAMNQSMQRLHDAADAMSRGATTLNAMLREVSGFIAQSRTTHEKLARATGHLSEVLAAARAAPALTGDQGSAASQQTGSIDELAGSLAHLKTHLAEFVSAIDPATKRLAMLHDTLADFEDAIDGYHDFDVPAANDERMQPSPLAESTSQSGFLSWLSRRPR